MNALFRGGSKGKVCDETPVVSTAQAVVEKIKQKKAALTASGTGSPTSKKKKGAVPGEGAVDGSENEESKGAPSQSASAKKSSKKSSSVALLTKTSSVKKSSKAGGGGTEIASSTASKSKKNPVRGEPTIDYKPVGLVLINRLDKRPFHCSSSLILVAANAITYHQRA